MKPCDYEVAQDFIDDKSYKPLTAAHKEGFKYGVMAGCIIGLIVGLFLLALGYLLGFVIFTILL